MTHSPLPHFPFPRFPFTLVAIFVALGCSRPPRTQAVLPVTATDSAAAGDTVAWLAPVGWARAGDIPESFRLGLDSTVIHGGTVSAYVESVGRPRRGTWGALIQQVDATAYAGKRVRVGGFVRRREVGTCEAFVRIDAQGDTLPPVVAFIGNQQKPLTCGRDWTEHSFVLDVPDSGAGRITYGFALRTAGRMWVDDVGLLVVDSTVRLDRQAEGLPRQPSPRGDDPWDPMIIGRREKPDSTARPTNLGFEK